MVKISKIYKIFIIICTAEILGYRWLLSYRVLGTNALYFVVASCGVVMALTVLQFCQHDLEFVSGKRLLSKYIFPYLIAVFIAAMYTYTIYDYSISDMLTSLSPYMYIFMAYPLVYVFQKCGSFNKFIKWISYLVIVMLVIKMASWYLYNFRGITIFYNILFEYGDWILNGVQRVSMGQLIGIGFPYFVSNGFSEKGKWQYKVIAIVMILFSGIVADTRYNTIVMAVILYVTLYNSYNKPNKKMIMRCLLILLALFVLSSNYFSSLVESFTSVSNYRYGSSAYRIASIQHYWEIMKEKKAILGLGLLITSNKNALSIMNNNGTMLFYLEDIGILGGIIRFGVLSLLIYAPLIVMAVKTWVLCRKSSASIHIKNFIYGMVIYLVMSCVSLNPFDFQRAYSIPFYIAIMSYVNYAIRRNLDLQ